MEVKLSNKTYNVREIKYKEIAKLGEISKEELMKQIMLLASDITSEEYEELSMKDGVKLQKVVNEINGLDEGQDFQKPLRSD